jgi:hypothetical protein
MKRKLGLPKEDLLFYLEKVRRMSRMDEDDALAELDEFLCIVIGEQSLSKESELQVDGEDESEDGDDMDDTADRCEEQRDEILGEISGVEDSIAELRRGIEQGEFHFDYLVNFLLRNVESIGSSVENESIVRELEPQISSVKARASDVVAEYERGKWTRKVDNALTVVLSGQSTVTRISTDLDRAETFLSSKGWMTSVIEESIRKGRQRLAWMRAKKKLDDLEVAVGTGNFVKAERLRRETEVLLRPRLAAVLPRAEGSSSR